MSEKRESMLCWSRLTLPLLLLVAVAAPSVLASGSSPAADLIAWIGVGPRMVSDGHLGGNNNGCTCNKDGDNQSCPAISGMNCTRTYHWCYDDGIHPRTNLCVPSGTATYCGGTSCQETRWGDCTGEC